MEIDPLIDLITKYNSFIEAPPVMNISPESFYSNPHHKIPIPNNVQVLSVKERCPILPQFQTDYDEIEHIRHAYEDYESQFQNARDITNFFEFKDNSIFMNRAAIKLANIDVVYQLCGDVFNLRNPTSNLKLLYCDIASGPGGFTQYWQYRYPNSIGYGMTLRGNLDFKIDKLGKNFNPVYGPSDSGDLYIEAPYLVDFLNAKGGMDIITGDGGMEGYEQEEFMSSRLLFCQAFVACNCLKVGGSTVLKIFDSVTQFSRDLLWLISFHFDHVAVVKPLTSRPANAERYIVGLGYKGVERGIWQNIYNKFNDREFVVSLFDNVDDEFSKWYNAFTTQSLHRQIWFGQRILNYLMAGDAGVPNVQNSMSDFYTRVYNKGVSLEKINVMLALP